MPKMFRTRRTISSIGVIGLLCCSQSQFKPNSAVSFPSVVPDSGVFLEVGCGSFDEESLSRQLVNAGWRGIAIDADVRFGPSFRRQSLDGGQVKFHSFLIVEEQEQSATTDNEYLAKSLEDLKPVEMTMDSLAEYARSTLGSERLDLVSLSVEADTLRALKGFRSEMERRKVKLLRVAAPPGLADEVDNIAQAKGLIRIERNSNTAETVQSYGWNE
jgi:hypothetical protein